LELHPSNQWDFNWANQIGLNNPATGNQPTWSALAIIWVKEYQSQLTLLLHGMEMSTYFKGESVLHRATTGMFT
jgi:hypothetical protein